MRKPVAKMVGIAVSKNLRLIFEATEGPRMDHPVAVSLKIGPVRMARLGIAPSEALFRTQRVRRKHDDKSNAIAKIT